ncbi:pentapeptide repeat-containing protein [Kiloniella majae]|uniref:pentapeptide repeat-containing protein n=1 Tax=Kiloniella majae TaxID=1938558 RepID=UPI001302945E|nr:pentapeptide repeat-containing protein [Kiloniella majae]
MLNIAIVNKIQHLGSDLYCKVRRFFNSYKFLTKHCISSFLKSAIFRLLTVILGVWVTYAELFALAEQRKINAWQILALQSSGNLGKVTALEFLNRNRYCIPFSTTCLFKKERLDGVDFSSLDLKHGPFLNHVNLTAASLLGVNFYNATLYEAVFNYSDMRQAKLKKAWAKSAKFENTWLQNSDFEGAFLLGASFKESVVNGASFAGTTLTYTDFSFASLENVNFENADISKTDFRTSENLKPEQLMLSCVDDFDHQPLLPDDEKFKELEFEVCASDHGMDHFQDI